MISFAVLVIASAATEGRIPSGTRAQIRMLDYVNTEHQPLGYTFRGIVEGNITVGDRIVVPSQSRVLLRLVADPRRAGDLTLEWWAIKFGDEWSEFRSAGGPQAGLFTTLRNVEDRRNPSPDSRTLVSLGPGLYIPFHSILHFEIRQPVQLLNVGRLRL